jgi:hypothetical protein
VLAPNCIHRSEIVPGSIVKTQNKLCCKRKAAERSSEPENCKTKAPQSPKEKQQPRQPEKLLPPGGVLARVEPQGEPTELRPPQSSKFAGRRSTSYIDWATLLKHTFDIDVLRCPKCDSTMSPIAAITRPDVIEKILTHLKLPVDPVVVSEGGTLAYDITGEPIDEWMHAHAEAHIQPAQRAPPDLWDSVDPPSFFE